MRCSQQTAAGRPCKANVMRGSDRCAAHLSLMGRKTNLTPELGDNLATMLRAGNYLAVALRAVSLPSGTYREWMRRGKSQQTKEAPYREFREQIEQAKAQGEVRQVTAIARAATESWQAAAWMLERQYPERWGRVSVRYRDDVPAAPAPAVEPDETDPFSEVDELAEKRKHRAV